MGQNPGLFEKAFGAGLDFFGAQRTKKSAEKMRTANINLLKEIDYEPEYAANHVPTYQKANSPVSRSYIDSMLLGNNPDAVSSVRPAAGLQKRAAQQSQNKMFGTPAARAEQQKAYMAATPWEVKAPTRPVVDKSEEDAQWMAQRRRYQETGTTKDLYDAFAEIGYPLSEVDSKGDFKDNIQGVFRNMEAQDLVKGYGSAKAAADALRHYGNPDEAYANAPYRKGKK